jgi:hypothetical protein
MRIKPVIFVVISSLSVAAIYSSFSVFEACAVRPDPGYSSPDSCAPGLDPFDRIVTCCWTKTEIDDDGTEFEMKWCQSCYYNNDDGSISNCDTKEPDMSATSIPNLSHPYISGENGDDSNNDTGGPNLGGEAIPPPFGLPNRIPLQPEEDKGTDSKSGLESPSPKVTIIKNQEPDADAGPDIKVYEGQGVSLNGTASSDPDGDKLAFSWGQKSPSSPTISLSNPKTSTPKFIAPQVGNDATFTFTLKVADENGAKDTDDVKVTVLNKKSVKKPIIE